MSSRLRPAIAVALLLATLTSSLSVAAAPKWAEADEHFRHGVQLFKENNFTAALIEFKRAYEIDPKYEVLYNIGESYYQIQDYANALRSFQMYLADGGTRIPLARRKAVEAEIATLSARVATLTITTTEPGAAITIDDVPVGKTPLPPITLSAGRRKITATAAGRVPVTQLVDLAGGDRKALLVEIAPLGTPEQRRRPPPPPSIIPQIVAWSSTGLVASGALVTGLLALRASSDLEDELVRFPGDADALASAKSSAFRLGLATDILLGTAAAAAAISIYFTVDWSLSSDAARPPRPGPRAQLLVSPNGVAVAGTF